MSKKYTINIEQPMIKAVDIEAETLEEAIEKATEMYNNEEIVITNDDTGTDAQIMGFEIDENGEPVEGGESTEWCDM